MVPPGLTAVRKNWDPIVPGACTPAKTLTAIVYTTTVVSFVTDWNLATIPIYLLWSVQMKVKIKIPVISILSLGIL